MASEWCGVAHPQQHLPLHDRARLQVDDRLGVQHETLLRQGLLDALQPRQLLQIPPDAKRFGLAFGDVLEQDDAALDADAGRERRRRVGHRQLAAVLAQEDVVLDPHQFAVLTRSADRALLDRQGRSVQPRAVQDGVNAPSPELPDRPAELILSNLVHVHGATFGVDGEDPFAHAVGHGAQVVAGLCKRPLGLLELRHVDRDVDDGGLDPALVLHQAAANVGEERRAVFAMHDVLAVGSAVAVEQRPCPLEGFRVRCRRPDRLADGPTDRLLRRPAVEALGAGVPGANDHVQVRDDHRDVDLVEQRRLHEELLLRLAAGRDVLVRHDHA